MVDSNLITYAQTDRQKEILEALYKEGTAQKAAKALGINSRSVERALQRVRSYAAKAGYSPDHGLKYPYPEGFALGKTTIQRGADGEIKNTWERMCADNKLQMELVKEAVASMAEDIVPAKPTKAPTQTSTELLNCYIITDYHIGMLSWHEETGESWDMDIAEKLLIDWFGAAIEAAPAAEIGVLAQIGDHLHFDGLESVTPSSGHQLDTDSRFPKLVRVAINTTRQVVQMMLKKHKKVHILMAEGNHDLASSVWLRELFHALYSEEPRVTVERSADPYYCIEHGKTSLFFHHGHCRKVKDIDHVFASKFREVFGRTQHSYAHMGHLHHRDLKETNLMIVEQHRTLAAKDAYATRNGYLSGRASPAITYHKEHGEVGRVTLTPEMVRT